MDDAVPKEEDEEESKVPEDWRPRSSTSKPARLQTPVIFHLSLYI